VSILCTRPEGAADPLVAALISAGHHVHAVPTVALLPVEPGGPLDMAAARIQAYDWVVVTSAMGATAILEAVRRAGAAGRDGDPTRAVAHVPRWAAVGRATAVVLQAAGVQVSVIPAISRGAAITEALLEAGPLTESRVLLPRSDRADEALPRALRVAGAAVDEVVAYRTIEGPPGNAADLADALAATDLQAIVICSGSALRGLLALSADPGETGIHPRVITTPLISIGPSTSTVISGAGLQVAIEASDPSVEGLLSAVQLLGAHVAPPPRIPQEVVS